MSEFHRPVEESANRERESHRRPHDRRAAVLALLQHGTWVALRPSLVEGIGVFAVRDIPQGCRDMFSKPDSADDWVTVPREEVEALPPHARRLVETYCLFDDEHYFVPTDGFKRMDLSLFLNHSDAPNVVSIDGGAYFEAVRPIVAGEELFIDYGTIVSE
jgi:SET domain-containing protein